VTVRCRRPYLLATRAGTTGTTCPRATLRLDLARRAFRELLPDRIRAHAMICFIALVLQRLTRARLRETPVDKVVSPERALSALRRIQTHRITLNDQRSLTGISTLDPEQTAILASLRVKKPTSADQYVNL